MIIKNPYSIKKLHCPNYDNELLPILIDKRYHEYIEPVASQWAWNAWHIYKLNTVLSCLRDISLLYWWCDIEGIELDKRLIFIELLSKSELQSLVKHLSIKRSSSGKNIGEAHRSTFNRRLYSVSKYISDVSYECLMKVECDTQYSRCEKKILSVQKFLSKCHYAYSSDLTKKSECISIQDVDLIQRIIVPGEYVNPFNNILCQWRNCVLINLLLESGMRRGEVVRLKLEDLKLDTHTPTVSIRVNHGCSDFPRREKPSVKTRGRTLPISPSLRTILFTYISEIRPQLDVYGSSRYLFLNSQDGRALGVSGVYQLLRRIEIIYPELEGKLAPHNFRVTAHNELRKSLENNPVSDNKNVQHGHLNDVMSYVGGWSSDSSMVNYYTEETLKQRLENITRKRG